MTYQTSFHIFKVDLAPHFALKARDAAVGKTARIDMAEISQVGRYVECQTVHRNETRRTHSDGANLACARPLGLDPYARSARYAPSRESI